MTFHELRTPLTIIDGHAQRLMKMSDQVELENVIERGISIREAVHRITRIMDRLLESPMMVDGHVDFRPSDVDLRAVLEDACHYQIRKLKIVAAGRRLPDPRLLVYQNRSKLPCCWKPGSGEHFRLFVDTVVIDS